MRAPTIMKKLPPLWMRFIIPASINASPMESTRKERAVKVMRLRCRTINSMPRILRRVTHAKLRRRIAARFTLTTLVVVVSCHFFEGYMIASRGARDRRLSMPVYRTPRGAFRTATDRTATDISVGAPGQRFTTPSATFRGQTPTVPNSGVSQTFGGATTPNSGVSQAAGGATTVKSGAAPAAGMRQP